MNRIAYQPNQSQAMLRSGARFEDYKRRERAKLDADLLKADRKNKTDLARTTLMEAGSTNRQKAGFGQQDKTALLNRNNALADDKRDYGRGLTTSILSKIQATGDGSISVPEDIAGMEAMLPGLAARVGQMSIDTEQQQNAYDQNKDRNKLLVDILKATATKNDGLGTGGPVVTEDPLHKTTRTAITNILKPGESDRSIYDLLGGDAGGAGATGVDAPGIAGVPDVSIGDAPALARQLQTSSVAPKVAVAPTAGGSSPLVSDKLINYKKKAALAHDRFVNKKRTRADSRQRGLEALRKRTMQRAGRSIIRNK